MVNIKIVAALDICLIIDYRLVAIVFIMSSSETSILSNITNRTKVSHKTSRLDLLDDTTLTSLPLPPPLKRKNTDYEDDTFNDDTLNEDSSDPIILVEDYLVTKPQLNKKKSLALFKSKLNKRIKINNDSDLFVNDCNLEKGLQHCNLCEKPLYELSSFINNKKKSDYVKKKYSEFVCQECIEIYDQFFHELSDELDANEVCHLLDSSFDLDEINENVLEEYQPSLPHQKSLSNITLANITSKLSHDNANLVKIFQSIHQKYHINHAPLKRKFSSGLLNRLNSLQNSSNSQTLNWKSIIDRFRNWKFKQTHD